MAYKLIVFHKREKKLFRLCDTHYLLWTFMDTAKILRFLIKVALTLADNEIYYNQIGLWEITI